MTTAIYPGAFDPVTRGHLDVVERAAGAFDHVILAVGSNPAKQHLFTLRERMALVKGEIAHLRNLEVCSFRGLIVDFARKRGVPLILRGVRSGRDLDYELHLAAANRLAGKVETILMAPRPEYACISAQFIKEIAAEGGDVSAMVTPAVETRLRAKLARKGRRK